MDPKTRIMKELKELQQIAEESSEMTVTAKIVGDDLKHWKGTIFGPKDTCYEEGVFKINIEIPQDYPFKPPIMKFDTKIWHPNISSQTGAICLDILKNEWTPALTIRTALISLQALLSAPEPDDPQDAEVATMYKGDRAEFNRKAQEWVRTFAKEETQDDKVKKITDMGFTEDQAREALEKFDWEEEAAVNSLLGM